MYPFSEPGPQRLSSFEQPTKVRAATAAAPARAVVRIMVDVFYLTSLSWMLCFALHAGELMHSKIMENCALWNAGEKRNVSRTLRLNSEFSYCNCRIWPHKMNRNEKVDCERDDTPQKTCIWWIKKCNSFRLRWTIARFQFHFCIHVDFVSTNLHLLQPTSTKFQLCTQATQRNDMSTR